MRVAIAAQRILVDAAHHDLDERRGRVRQRRRRIAEHGGELRGGTLRVAVRAAAGDQLVDHDAEREHVALGRARADHLLGRHVAERADHLADLREVGAAFDRGVVILRDAEVEHLDEVAVVAAALEVKMFSGLRSRWTMPRACASPSE